MDKNRVVITGMGVVSPLGCDIYELFSNLVDGNPNFAKPAHFEREYEGGSMLVSSVPSEYYDECIKYGISPERSISNYSLLACKKSLENAGLIDTSELLYNADLHIGTSESYSFDNLEYLKYDEMDVCKYLKGRYPADTLYNVASKINVKGETMLFPVACSGGNVAIATGAKKIKYGYKDICIVGGVDCLSEKSYTTFHCLGALSNSSCKPFDKKRDGITVGEGAGFLVLENLEHALKRGASILAEVIGYNIACDAYHLTTPDIQGIMASKSMEKAIMMSNISPSDISYISPHGTGTYSNDLQEANAIFKVFGEKGSTVPISAIKSILGHCMGSASAIEAIAITLSIVNNVIPKTINVDSTDSTFPCELNTTQYEDTNISTVLSNSFAFGGNICAVVFSKY